MPSAKDVFVRCDELDLLPDAHKRNYLYELDWLEHELGRSSHVLQVGSMDGMRALRLLEVRPDVVITGLEIEPSLVEIARDTLSGQGKAATFIPGDITAPPLDIGTYDYVLCLNNTLGYITDTEKALSHMKRMGSTVIVSVYGEAFDDALASRYFDAIGLKVRRISGDTIVLDDFSSVTRFSKTTVESWNGDRLVETPIGYLTVLRGTVHPQ